MSFLVSSAYFNNNVVVCNALDEIRIRWILREKADCKQSTITHTNFFSKTLYFVHNINGSVTFSSRKQVSRGKQLLDKDFLV